MNRMNYSFKRAGRKLYKLTTLTDREQAAVEMLIASVNRLPKSICIGFGPTNELVVNKRADGGAWPVCHIVKRSLTF